jgi:hypothetical protein
MYPGDFVEPVANGEGINQAPVGRCVWALIGSETPLSNARSVPRFLVEHHVHLCCLIAMGSVCGQFRFAGRFDPIEPKWFGLIRKFCCGMSIQMAYFQARVFDRNCVAIVGV